MRWLNDIRTTLRFCARRANSSSDPEAHLVLICGRRNVTKNSVKLAKIPNISGTLCWVGFMFGCRSAATLNTESDRRRAGFVFRCRFPATPKKENDPSHFRHPHISGTLTRSGRHPFLTKSAGRFGFDTAESEYFQVLIRRYSFALIATNEDDFQKERN